jgi:hypothetical protein
VGSPLDVAARAIVLQVHEWVAPDLGSGDVDDAARGSYLVTLTVMPQDGLPFRCRVIAALPADTRWNVQIGAHVPVVITVATRVVRLDTDALRALYETT